jgi:S-adenosylmethionine:tRNA ribosyltransferase-isomerase
MLTLQDFSYHLPPESIAHSPASPRDSSRLLLVDRASEQLSDHIFKELPSLLKPGDVLVRNNTQVIPARIHGRKTTGGVVELLLAKQVELTAETATWECLTKPGLKPGQVVEFEGTRLQAECQTSQGYARLLRFNQSGHEFFDSLNKIGETPLPPYIKWHSSDSAELRSLYQTIYAKIPGSAAAPTAGLHFTSELDQALLNRGIQIEEVTLHVGLGTFLPVKITDITQHHMHQEWFSLSQETAARLNRAKAAGQRIISVGTTTTRVLETCAEAEEISHSQNHLPAQLKAQEGETQIYIFPPYQFKFIDGLITNFHLPESTLLMLISAFTTAPQTSHDFSTFADSLIGRAYQKAIASGYRFYSFGDAMLIL